MPLELKKDIHLPDLRRKASTDNMASEFARKCMASFVCPFCRGPLRVSDEQLLCDEGHAVPIHSGFPDFTSFSETSVDEKASQARFHDDEELNETFDEIVLRPYNYNKVHADTWLYHLRYFGRILPSKLGIDLENTTILNCGCGGGFEAEVLAKEGALVVGFDISQLRVEAAATRFALGGLPGFFYQGDASLLPFPDDSFDLVFFHDSLHHVPIEEIPVAVREAARVARIGVVILEPHDSPLRMLLETVGLSTSIEKSGNYVFRFKKSLMTFWGSRNSLALVNYSVLFTIKEHRAKIYAIPVVGWVIYKLLRLLGVFLAPLGNEACIIYEKLRPEKPVH
jgi:ubiquinone/menaquinone biosynthesis C-methylase UbiE